MPDCDQRVNDDVCTVFVLRSVHWHLTTVEIGEQCAQPSIESVVPLLGFA